MNSFNLFLVIFLSFVAVTAGISDFENYHEAALRLDCVRDASYTVEMSPQAYYAAVDLCLSLR